MISEFLGVVASVDYLPRASREFNVKYRRRLADDDAGTCEDTTVRLGIYLIANNT